MYWKETYTEKDEDGNILHQETTEKELCKDLEPEYIKIYTHMWFDFKRFPQQYRELFFQLAIKMSYCNAMDFEHSQIVFVTGPNRDDIMKACGWTNVSSLTKGLNALCNCGAIRRVSRGIYQINPEFAGKGSWRYNSKLDQGGIKNIIAEFNFALNKVRTRFNIEYDDEEE